MLSLIGQTPIIKLKNTINNHNFYAKCEWLNPTGSIKDRVAKYILEDLIINKKYHRNKLLSKLVLVTWAPLLLRSVNYMAIQYI